MVYIIVFVIIPFPFLLFQVGLAAQEKLAQKGKTAEAGFLAAAMWCYFAGIGVTVFAMPIHITVKLIVLICGYIMGRMLYNLITSLNGVK